MYKYACKDCYYSFYHSDFIVWNREYKTLIKNLNTYHINHLSAQGIRNAVAQDQQKLFIKRSPRPTNLNN